MDERNEEFPFESTWLRKRVTGYVRNAARDLVLPDSATDDVAQIVIMKLLTHDREKLRSVRDFDSYLFRIARNEALRFQQRSKTKQLVQADDDSEPISDRSAFSQQVDSYILLKEIWGTLQNEERELFRLMLIGYKAKDIALRLGLSHDVVRKRVSRLREKLRQLIE